MNYYIGDLHFGHQHVIQRDNRPYEFVEDMDNDLMEKWNTAVDDTDDHVYILGDFSWYSPDITQDILRQLNGKKHLVIGNHDHIWLNTDTAKYFESIEYYTFITDNIDNTSYGVTMTHHPVHLITGHRRASNVLLYAHVHNSEEHEFTELLFDLSAAKVGSKAEHFNVGCMMPYMDYQPRTLKDIMLRGRRHREETKSS